MKIKKLSTKQIKGKMDNNPHKNSQWYQQCEAELKRRKALPPKTVEPKKPKVTHHNYEKPLEKVVTRAVDKTLAPTHNKKQKQKKVTLSPRVTQYI